MSGVGSHKADVYHMFKMIDSLQVTSRQTAPQLYSSLPVVVSSGSTQVLKGPPKKVNKLGPVPKKDEQGETERSKGRLWASELTDHADCQGGVTQYFCWYLAGKGTHLQKNILRGPPNIGSGLWDVS